MSRSFRMRMSEVGKKQPPAVTADDISSVVDRLRAKTPFEDMNSTSDADPSSDRQQDSPVGSGVKETEAGILSQKNAPETLDERADTPPGVQGDSAEGWENDGGGCDAEGKEGPSRSPGDVRELFGDVCVCQALGIRRRIIAAARTKMTRGEHWDCIGRHAGMTRKWIEAKALELHVVPRFEALKPIQADDNVVSCVLAAVVNNPRRAIAEIVATGERIPVWVRDSTTMCFREIFDCYDDHGTVSMLGSLNEVKY